MKTVICEFCGKESIGTERRKFCSVNCRVGAWQKKHSFRLKLNKKAKAKRFEFAKPTYKSTEDLQFQYYDIIIQLSERVRNDDRLALMTIREGDKLLNKLAQELDYHEEN